MPAIITNKFRVLNAKTFMSSNDNYYMFIGRPQSWENDLIPDTPIDNVHDEASIWDDMMSIKKITASNMSFGIIKRIWSSGKHYDIYRSDYGQSGVTGVNIDTGASDINIDNIVEANYYVITAPGNIYICIDNANGDVSTESPDLGTPDASYIYTCSDGYIWRKIAITSNSNALSFSTPQYHPIKTLISDPTVSDPYYTQWLMQEQAKLDQGILLNAIIVNAGSGYGVSQTDLAGIVTVNGDGIGATILVNTNSIGAITKLTISDRGFGYTWATLSFSGAGAGASGKAIVGPLLGLGADPVMDLCGCNTIINTKFEYSEGGDFTTNNDYRRIGMLVNPKGFNSSNLYTASTGEVTTILKLNNISGLFAVDDTIRVTGSGAKPHAKIVDIIAGTGDDTGLTLVRIIRTKEENSLTNSDAHTDFAVLNTIQNEAGASGVIDSITTSDIEIGSGNIIYIENRRQINRNPDQIESITTVFEW